MAIFETTDHAQAAKQAGKDPQLIPSPTEAKDAQAYFDGIINNEKAHSTLPNVSFHVVARNAKDPNSYYSLEQWSSGANGHKTVVELGRFQEYTNGLTAKHQMLHATDDKGKKILRETDEVSTPTRSSIQVSEAPDDGVPRVRNEVHRKVTDLKDGKEVDCVTIDFGYSDKTGKKNAETLVSHKADGSTITQVFGGEDNLKLSSEVDTDKDGKETGRATIVDILNDKNEKTGRRETVWQRNKDNATTTIYEGPDDDNLKPVQLSIAYDNGTTETYTADKDGHMKLSNTTKSKS